jgi:alpha-amylase
VFIVCLQFSVFDAPLHYNFKEAADAGRDYDIRKVWDGTLVQARPVDAVYVHSLSGT